MRTLLAIVALTLATPAFAGELYSTTETDIGTLLDNESTKAILEKHIPGMTTGSQIDMARAFTLKDIQQYAADQVTDEVLAKIDAEFKALADAK